MTIDRHKWLSKIGRRAKARTPVCQNIPTSNQTRSIISRAETQFWRGFQPMRPAVGAVYDRPRRFER